MQPLSAQLEARISATPTVQAVLAAYPSVGVQNAATAAPLPSGVATDGNTAYIALTPDQHVGLIVDLEAGAVVRTYLVTHNSLGVERFWFLEGGVYTERAPGGRPRTYRIKNTDLAALARSFAGGRVTAQEPMWLGEDGDGGGRQGSQSPACERATDNMIDRAENVADAHDNYLMSILGGAAAMNVGVLAGMTAGPAAPVAMVIGGAGGWVVAAPVIYVTSQELQQANRNYSIAALNMRGC